MDSPLARVIAALLGGWIVLLLLWTGYDWYRAEYPSPPQAREPSVPIQHPFYHRGAMDALVRFSQLSRAEQHALRIDLAAGLIPVEQWLSRIDRRGYEIICIGERHEESTRRFLAEALLPGLRADVLMLETTPDGLDGLMERMRVGRFYYPMLGADMMALLRSVTTANPTIELFGIEETERQVKQPGGLSGARDRRIADNFWNRFQPGRRNVVLFGAFHCARAPGWMYGRLHDRAAPGLRSQMINTQVLEVHQNGALEAFVFFLDGIGLGKAPFVIADTRGLPADVYRWFPVLDEQILETYCALIVFRA